MQLYDYFRSTASYRVRIALMLKGLTYEKITIHLVNNGGEQHSDAYKIINPQELVPTLRDEEITLSQSMAIMDYLEECYPNPTLYPTNISDKYHAKSFALTIACDMHPLNNLRVLNQLKTQFNASETDVSTWYLHWLKKGFDALEIMLKNRTHKFAWCFADYPTVADICLIPQMFNAHRFHFNMSAYPHLNKIEQKAKNHEAFYLTAPEADY